MDDRIRILVVDDDASLVALLIEILHEHHDVSGVTSAREALERVARDEVDLLITDFEMPEMRGIELIEAASRQKVGLLSLVVTAFGSIELAVQSIRAGACDLITKPFKRETLVVAIERALRERTLRREIVRLRRELDGERGLVVHSPAMRRVLEIATRAARSDAPVAITGEAGAGKRMMVRWIHDHGPRRDGPLIHVNCVFEDELERERAFVEARGGTVCLDAVTEMSLDAQARLFEVLETTETPDVRVITTSRRPLEEAVRGGRFRSDLFYRIDVIPLAIPPLRERREDIPDLVHVFINQAMRGATPVGISEDAMRWLVAQDWPGNVRELGNAVERAVARAEHDTLVLEDFTNRTWSDATDILPRLLELAAERSVSLSQLEDSYVRSVVAHVGRNMSRAAKILGIDRRTLYRRLAEN